MMGMFHETSQVSFETLTTILADLTSELPEDQKSPLIVRLRGTWLLEKVARNHQLFKDDKHGKLVKMLEPLCDYFCKCDQFVFQY